MSVEDVKTKSNLIIKKRKIKSKKNIQFIYKELLEQNKIKSFESNDFFKISPDDFTYLHLKNIEFKKGKITFVELNALFHEMAVNYLINFDRLWYEVVQRDRPRLSKEDYKEIYRMRQELSNSKKATLLLDNAVVCLTIKELIHLKKLLSTF